MNLVQCGVNVYPVIVHITRFDLDEQEGQSRPDGDEKDGTRGDVEVLLQHDVDPFNGEQTHQEVDGQEEDQSGIF